MLSMGMELDQREEVWILPASAALLAAQFGTGTHSWAQYQRAETISRARFVISKELPDVFTEHKLRLRIKSKLSSQQPAEAYRVVRCSASHTV
jgi:hypothetical protein